MITCPNSNTGSERLERAQEILSNVGLLDMTTVKEFETDDEDRIRGCYSSHISVLREAKRTIGSRKRAAKPAMVLVLEDNLQESGSLAESTLSAIGRFAADDLPWDMIHLSYISYVPNFSVKRTPNPNVVRLVSGVGSALGTTAYLISLDGIEAVLGEHDRRGYVAPIPDVMAALFPESRYASFPAPFQRAAALPSLVNPQLDDLRSLLFRPAVSAAFEKVLVYSGLGTNTLFPIMIGGLLLAAGASFRTSGDAILEYATTGSYQGNFLLPVLSSLSSVILLSILAQGVLLAPKQPTSLDN